MSECMTTHLVVDLGRQFPKNVAEKVSAAIQSEIERVEREHHRRLVQIIPIGLAWNEFVLFWDYR